MTETIHTTPMMQAIDEASRTGAKKFRSKTQPQEWGLISLRECPLPSELKECTCPAQAASYWGTGHKLEKCIAKVLYAGCTYYTRNRS